MGGGGRAACVRVPPCRCPSNLAYYPRTLQPTPAHPRRTQETFVNGVRTKTYANGAVRILFANGTRETRLPDGRVRIQDGQGNVLHSS